MEFREVRNSKKSVKVVCFFGEKKKRKKKKEKERKKKKGTSRGFVFNNSDWTG